MIVYPARDIPPFVMYCVNGKPCSSLLIELIPCRTFSSVYVGQTSRLLKTRIDEHKAAVKYGKSDVSAVAEHVWADKHNVDFQSVSVLAWEPDIHQRLSLESWYIRTLKTFNRERKGSWILNTTVYFLPDFSLTGFFLLPYYYYNYVHNYILNIYI